MLCSYWLDPYSLFFIEVILMQFAEIRRWQDFRKPGSQGEQYFLGLETVLKGSGDPSYPGEPHSLAAGCMALPSNPSTTACSGDWQKPTQARTQGALLL